MNIKEIELALSQNYPSNVIIIHSDTKIERIIISFIVSINFRPLMWLQKSEEEIYLLVNVDTNQIIQDELEPGFVLIFTDAGVVVKSPVCPANKIGLEKLLTYIPSLISFSDNNLASHT